MQFRILNERMPEIIEPARKPRSRPGSDLSALVQQQRGVQPFVHKQLGVCIVSGQIAVNSNSHPLLQLLLLTNGQLQVLHERFGAHGHALKRTYRGSKLLIEPFKPTQDSPVRLFQLQDGQLEVPDQTSYAVAMELQNLQCFARHLQSCRSMRTENYGDLVELLDCDRLQIISMTTSAGFGPRLCGFQPRCTAAQAQIHCSSASDALQLWLRGLQGLHAEEVKSVCRVLQLQGCRRRFWNFLDYDRVY